MDPQARVAAWAALQMASGATDEEWAAVTAGIKDKEVPGTSTEVVAQVRAELARVRGTAAER
jgi:hypothetical protein